MNSDNKKKYQHICDTNYIPIFSQPWWLDCAAGPENWSVALVERGTNILAAMPYSQKSSLAFRIYKMPELTPWHHIFIDYPAEQKETRRLAFEKEMLQNLLGQLPERRRFQQKYSYNLTNWLPFYWQGFHQTTRYSYVLDLKNPKDLFNNFRSNIRREIRKAEKRLSVIQNDDVAEFFRLNQMTFQRQRSQPSYSFELLQNLDRDCKNRQCRKIWFAVDDKGQKHAALYIVWDQLSAYYLMGGADPALRNSGASSLLMWNAIKSASLQQEKFDFEGSMIEPIERFFRSFGARQMPYFSITKNKFPFNLIDLFR